MSNRKKVSQTEGLPASDRAEKARSFCFYYDLTFSRGTGHR